MECPRCSKVTKILETRGLRRYRRCTCGVRFTTVETVDIGSQTVRKRSGSDEPFSRAKLTKSIKKAVIRELPAAELTELVDRVVFELVTSGAFNSPLPADASEAAQSKSSPLLETVVIGQTVLDVLRAEAKLEAVYVRYALLFEPSLGTFSDAESLVRWLLAHRRHGIAAPAPPDEPEFVLKRDGSVVPFDRAKLERSVRLAAKKKPTADAQADDELFGSEIAEAVLDSVKGQSTVTSGQLATEVMRLFRTGDGVENYLERGERELAYLRAASTAKNFTSIKDFLAEASGLMARSD